ncbi:Heat shock protein [Plasmodium coatneyi]|uniref:Heat shock protein n=1 Tax=Plasmodium coatneyi TaxID=208452 RepID=A0A1B1DUK0_9APIC|nr:Heat shock protein [Plasmodium coatneyi]ANQ06458.1 Heat shock protein [Plasmodium coatneyi]
MVTVNSTNPQVVIESSGVPTIRTSSITSPVVLTTPLGKSMYSSYSYSNPVSSSYSSHNECEYNWERVSTKPSQSTQHGEYMKTFEVPTGLYYETMPLTRNTNNIFEVTPSKEELNKINYNPRIEVYSTSNFVIIMMDLPGVSKENLKVELENGVLKIFGHKYKVPLEELQTEHEYHTKIIERVGEYYFCKMFQMPPVFSDGQSISCTLRDGELTLKMLASELRPQKRVVEVQS